MFTARSLSLSGVAAALAALGTWRVARNPRVEDGDLPSPLPPGPGAVSPADRTPLVSQGPPPQSVPAGGAAVMESISGHSKKHLKKEWGKHKHRQALKEAVDKSRALVKQVMLKQGVPGAVVAVIKDGRLVWSEGVGLADVENDTPCTAESVMRIASISKPLATVALLQLYQRNLIDLDAPIQEYVPEFPRKKYAGEDVVISVRMLLSHMAGIRHYQKAGKEGEKKAEFYIQSHFDSVKDSIKLFAEDELVCKPGTRYKYTTHGWTLLSAVIEKASGMPFLDYMRKSVLGPLGMNKTSPELTGQLIYGRAKHYVRKNGILRNVPYVDLSYKWAGGGYISNAEDLVKFGTAVLACWQMEPRGGKKGLLKRETASLMLTPVVESKLQQETPPISPAPPVGYGMGWLLRRGRKGYMEGKEYPFFFGHTGGAVGASSVLMVMPAEGEESRESVGERPRGVAVAVIFNLRGVKGVFTLGLLIAEQFHSL